MKIGELDQHCGNCSIIEFCGEPFDEVCLCCNSTLEDLTEEEYLSRVDKVINSDRRRVFANAEIEEIICNELEGDSS